MANPICYDPARKCESPGCSRPARSKGVHRGRRRYDRFCQSHHRRSMSTDILAIENKQCEKCGWDKAPCDRHRVDPSKGYVRENVLVLCPNCHRLEHYAKGAKGD